MVVTHIYVSISDEQGGLIMDGSLDLLDRPLHASEVLACSTLSMELTQ